MCMYAHAHIYTHKHMHTQKSFEGAISITFYKNSFNERRVFHVQEHAVTTDT